MSEYTSTPSTGRLKLKSSTQISGIDKKKKKKKPAPPSSSPTTLKTSTNDTLSKSDRKTNSSTEGATAISNALADEDQAIPSSNPPRETSIPKDDQNTSQEATEEAQALKTEAERKHQEKRRKMLHERLKKEGVKSHKQRVEELNKYLSGLSEHHDMPKIGPG